MFVQNLDMTFSATGVQDTDAKIQYLCTLVNGEALRRFDLLSDDIENTDTSLSVDYLIKALALYFPPVNSLSKIKCAMCCCTKKNPQFKSEAPCSVCN